MGGKNVAVAALIETRQATWAASATLLIGLAACALAPMARADNAPQPSEADIAAARAATKDLGETLKSQLVAALKQGGPRAAVDVCRTIAPAVATETSGAHGLEVGRTALKVRNPANAPDAFERKVLEEFVRKIDAGADAATLDHAEMVDENGKPVFRYMKAIPTAAEPCLTCHGGNIDPALKTEILRLYPEDQATGFKAGELRGAFTVTRKMR